MFKRPEAHPDLSTAIDQILNYMVLTNPDADEYHQMTENVTKLLRAEDDLKSKRRISPDTWAIIGANLLGIVLVMNHERGAVITTKALGFLPKLK